ncbi:UNVERIFIED_CONTAM: hypothetical protein K2H54_004281 [Gekko kuhli]
MSEAGETLCLDDEVSEMRMIAHAPPQPSGSAPAGTGMSPVPWTAPEDYSPIGTAQERGQSLAFHGEPQAPCISRSIQTASGDPAVGPMSCSPCEPRVGPPPHPPVVPLKGQPLPGHAHYGACACVTCHAGKRWHSMASSMRVSPPPAEPLDMAFPTKGMLWFLEEVEYLLRMLYQLEAGPKVMPSTHLETLEVFEEVAQCMATRGYCWTAMQYRVKFKREKATLFDALEDWEGIHPRGSALPGLTSSGPSGSRAAGLDGGIRLPTVSIPHTSQTYPASGHPCPC